MRQFPFLVVALSRVDSQAKFPGGGVVEIAGVCKNSASCVLATAAFRRPFCTPAGSVEVEADRIAYSPHKMPGGPAFELAPSSRSRTGTGSPVRAASPPVAAGLTGLLLYRGRSRRGIRRMRSLRVPLRHLCPPLLGPPKRQRRIRYQSSTGIVPQQ